MDNTARRVLIIDPSLEQRTQIRRLLETGPGRRYHFIECADGTAGLRACLDNGAVPPDCVLLAERLPDGDALQVLDALGDYPVSCCPVVVVAEEDSKLDTGRALRAGAQDLIGRRVINADSLVRAMDNAILRHTLARELRGSEARLRLGSELAGLAVIEIDYLADMMKLGPEAATVLGLPDTLRTVPRALVHSLFHPEDRAAIDAQIARALRPEHGVLALQHRILTPAGQVRWLSVRKQVFFRHSPSGKVRPTSALLMLRDITGQKQAETQAQEHQARLAGIVDSAMDAIITVDAWQRVVLFNAAAERIFRCPAAEAIGGPLERFIPQGLRAAHREHFRQFGSGPAQARAMGRDGFFSGLRADNEEFPIEASISRVETGGEPFFTIILRDITRRKQAETALRESEERFRTFFETIPVGVAYQDAAGRIILMNPAAERILGLSQAELMGGTSLNLEQACVREDGSPFPRTEHPALVSLRTGREVRDVVMGFRNPRENDWRWISIHSVPQFRPGETRPWRVYTVFRDITDQRRAEIALNRSENRYRLLSDTAGRLLTAEDPHELINELCHKVMAHLDCQAFFNHLVDESGQRLRLNAWAGVPAAVAADIEHLGLGEAICGNMARTQRRVVIEDIANSGDDRAILLQSLELQAYCCHPLVAGSRLIGTLAFGTRNRSRFAIADIELMRIVADQVAVAMQRILSQHDLQASEERYRGLVEQAADGIFVSDAEGHYLDINSAGAAMLGYRREEILQLGLTDTVAPPEIPRLAPEVARLAEGTVACSEWLFRRKDGSLFPGEIMARRLPGGRLQAILRDISERKQNEAKLREQAQRLREADRRKDEFLAMLAHELRNPLAPIRNAANILRHPRLALGELGWCRDIIERQIEQLTRLVDDLLDVSRITRGHIDLKQTAVEVAAILGRGVETSLPALESQGHQLAVTLPDPPLWVRGDLIRLAQVVSNLLNNAAKYTDPGGRIELGTWTEGGRVVISVRDNGRGIDPAALPELFDLFYQVEQTLERTQGGLGIGLSLVKRLVELHGGVVEAHSAGRGRGSEFVVRLPRLAEPDPARAIPSDPAGTPPSPRRVLIVDDNEDAADSLSLLLGLEGHQTLTAHDGRQALALALSERPEAILLDIGLPGLSGYEVCRKIREAGMAETLIVAVTGYGQDGDIRLAREAGFDAHRVKPVDPEDIRALLAHNPNTPPT
ncbi:PAS domain S-box-containing protein [Methylomagnum ishizawai]|uniref:histidine kinase n=1 Tax=Methylomagnum ishizawai TaxID=1760988 RepID=A0A1Y6CX13_9GAMM|nr:PAS domain S-box protein [Methylomagnum ishizawai]SMF94780.1 PAS domain S-box-containing protein [Methylomagnum ishizawai]